MITEKTNVSDLVLRDIRVAEIFIKNDIDFCCNGNRSLEQACNEKGLIIKELIDQIEGLSFPEVKEENLIEVLDHIEGFHHKYARQTIPLLIQFAEKIHLRHGQEYPEIVEAIVILKPLPEEMELHMAKEEMILFPFIKTLVNTKSRGGQLEEAPFETVANPIQMMKEDHEEVGDALRKLKSIANSLSRNPHPCTTFQTFLNTVHEFEKNTMLHVHLENNLVFPRALDLEAKYSTKL